MAEDAVEVNEWTDWIPEITRIKRMQEDIDALKCERAELVETLHRVVTFGYDNDALNLLSRYGR